jgi:multiple sugar transport system ATP-binding protein
MPAIELRGVTKVYDGGVRAVDDITLTVESGEFMVLVGPSGCGKSTLMRMIAGLEEITHGTISIDGQDVTNLSPRQRDIAMVFQNYALYPHMTVRKNLGYGLKMRKTPRREIERRVAEVAQLLGLEELLDRRPAKLSGGQRQRVAMGRAIVREPQAFLMDEPLSNLDAKLRVAMRAELARLHERLRVTTVYVTHDQVEAMTLGQRVAVMRLGVIQQVDTPQTLYRRPANLFVAAFMGSPSMNLVHATISDGHASFAGFRVPLDPSNRPVDDGDVVLGLRPQCFEDAALSDPGLPRLEVTVSVLEELGSEVHVIFAIDAPPVRTEETAAALDAQDETTLVADDARALFTARVDPRTSARVGEPAALTVDPAQFHFFDPVTGRSMPVTGGEARANVATLAPGA